jgi:hypothetical protein
MLFLIVKTKIFMYVRASGLLHWHYTWRSRYSWFVHNVNGSILTLSSKHADMLRVVRIIIKPIVSAD